MGRTGQRRVSWGIGGRDWAHGVAHGVVQRVQEGAHEEGLAMRGFSPVGRVDGVALSPWLSAPVSSLVPQGHAGERKESLAGWWLCASVALLAAL